MQHDEPRRVDEEARGEADDRHDVLRLAEQLPDQRHAAGRLPARALEPVLQLAVLEVLEIERGRMLHQPQARRVAEALGQQRIEQRHGSPEHVGERPPAPNSSASSHRMRSSQPFANHSPKVVRRVRRLREQHHLVDDELARRRAWRRAAARARSAAPIARASSTGWSARRAAGTAARCASRQNARGANAARNGRRGRPRSPWACARPSNSCGACRYCAAGACAGSKGGPGRRKMADLVRCARSFPPRTMSNVFRTFTRAKTCRSRPSTRQPAR